MNVLITTGADDTLTVHRESCKKIEDRETEGVDDVLLRDPGALTTAKKASCCKPTDVIMEEVEQAGWAALEAKSNADAAEDLIGTPEVEEDLIGEPAPKPAPAKGKTAAKVEKAKTEAKELNGQEALVKVAAHLDIDLGKKPVFPGFGRAFKTAAKQSVYINSKGNADARATDTAQADAWAKLPNVERRSGNYVRVNLAAL